MSETGYKSHKLHHLKWVIFKTFIKRMILGFVRYHSLISCHCCHTASHLGHERNQITYTYSHTHTHTHSETCLKQPLVGTILLNRLFWSLDRVDKERRQISCNHHSYYLLRRMVS